MVQCFGITYTKRERSKRKQSEKASRRAQKKIEPKETNLEQMKIKKRII